MRKKIFRIVEKSKDETPVERLYDWYIMAVCILSVIPMMFRGTNRALQTIETVSVYLLFLDYVFRWITYDYRLKKHKPIVFLRYPLTPMAIMDILGILPTIGLLPQSFMILRLLRLAKIVRYSDNFQRIVNVFKNQKKILLSVLSIAVAYIFIAALVMFVHEPADNFPTFFDALYWSTTALTTVGYGDIYPATDIGKFISMLSSLFGVAVIAMPASIVTAGFMDELHKKLDGNGEKAEETKNEEGSAPGNE